MNRPADTEPHATWQLRRSLIELTGPDARRFLNGQLTQDLGRMRAGQSCAACLADHKGKLVAAPLFVHLLGNPEDGSFLIDGPPELGDVLLARLDRYLIADDCELSPAGDRFTVVHVSGSAPPSTETDAAALWLHRAPNPHRFGFVSGVDLVRAASPPPQHGSPPPSPSQLGIVAAAPGGDTEWQRVTAGLPEWGKELDPETLPAEAGLDGFAVSFTKGCYLGQEVISRIKSVGRVNRRLHFLRPIDPLPPDGLPLDLPAALDRVTQAGVPTERPDSPHCSEPRPDGHLTSLASRAGETRALGFVSRSAASTGGLLRTRSTEKMLACRFEIGPPAPARYLVLREGSADLHS